MPVSDLNVERVVVPAPAAARAPAPAPVPILPKAPAAPAPAAKAAVGMPADGDLKTFLFNVISEKTGYPVDILNLDQQLEADLGIDSIKRVEILSAFEGQIPDIKDVNLEEVARASAPCATSSGSWSASRTSWGSQKKKNNGEPG